MTVFLDLTRISSRLLRGAPTGIDRVEYAYAEELVLNERYGPVVPVITTPLAVGAIPVQTMRDHLMKIEAGWLRDRVSAADDPYYMALKQAIDAPPEPRQTGATRLKRQSRRQVAAKTLQFPFRQIAAAPGLLRRTLAETGRTSRCYFHASHTQLDKPDRFAWLGSHGMPSVFLIHDAIPVDYPEFCSPGSAERHHRRLKTVSDCADLIIVNSAATETAVARYMRRQGWRVPRTEVVHLGVDRWFTPERTEASPIPQAPYFVCVGTIEPRKNLIFLMNVWRGVVERLGQEAPKLVLVGRRGWENENIVDVLERSCDIGAHLVEVADLSDLGLSALIKGARALLAPSLVEGFSLPVAEALALGTPVIASDIAVHREIADDRALLVGAIDGNAWVEAVVAISAPGSALRAEWTARASGYVPMSWGRHVERAMEAIDAVRTGRVRD
ncbi:glycosyltransferase family 4 protein [Jiella avicenniae]|uniref:Glycosyltransferase family 4 protein n=1 Tax=Jiella avicenniae TaxID=2907202 RepID=A0A9X1P0N4_9HYPH|nr:glycosyltransferase family 1 protein [Jiella avicenniae]MCE7029167.1 glycosyltransferase family 4 protein [Jiella avicenniae]